MKNNKNAFSLAIAMGLVLITSLLAFTILEYMIPFSKNISWIENSTMAYYKSNNWVELGLYFLNSRSDNELKNSSSRNYITDQYYDYEFTTEVSWNSIPRSWRWNSFYNDDYNRILSWNPIQLTVGYNYLLWWNFNISFIVPDLDRNWLLDEELDTSLWDDLWIVNWQLTSDNSTLNSHSGSLFTVWEINNMTDDISPLVVNMFNRQWRLLDGTPTNFGSFYNTNCTWSSDECILKFSIINVLKTSDSWVPYLQWRATTWTDQLPLRYSIIESEWKSYGFVKWLNVRVPQETVSEAFDFTVIQ